MDRIGTLNQGAAALRAGQVGVAEAVYRGYLAQAPDDVEVLSNLGAVLNVARDYAGAEAACRAALRILPGYWAALANLATSLHRQQRFMECLPVHADAVRANPGNASAWTNFAVALQEQGRLADCFPLHDAAVALAPDDAEIHVNRAMGLLMAGDFKRGFAEFDWRWRIPAMARALPPGRQWIGGPVSGRRVLVLAEGGFGDTLQFMRFIPEIVARGAHVAVRAPQKLLALMRRSLPDTVSLSAPDTAWPDHDMFCPMLSLPRALGTTLHDLPAKVPYLAPCPQAVARWAAWLAAHQRGTGPRVGLVWEGAPLLGMAQMRAMNQRRSMRLAQLAPLARLRGVQFVSLQHGGMAEAAAAPSGMALLDPMGEVADFDDTAALIANLDLVIAVDTAVAHLAGALGRKVWVLSRFDACWRWLAGRADSPWYPSLRLYRQARPGDWPELVRRVAADARLFRRDWRCAAP